MPAPGASVSSTIGTPAAATPSPRAVGIVPIEAVPSVTSSPAGDRAGAARVTLTAPSAPDGALAAGGGPHTIPITIANAPPIVSLSLTVTFDPAVVKPQAVTQGAFMTQGGAAPTFVPRIDAAAGRIDLAFTRPASAGGASNGGLVGAISFLAGTAGTTDVTITGVATGVNGQTVLLDFTPARLVVK
jgi:hypothetical protein